MATFQYASSTSGNDDSSSHHTSTLPITSPSTASARPGPRGQVEIVYDFQTMLTNPPDHRTHPDVVLRGLNKGGNHEPCLVYALAQDGDYHVLDMEQTRALNRRWSPSVLEEKIRQAPQTKTFPDTDYAATRHFVEASKKKAEQEATNAAETAAKEAQPGRNAYGGTNKGNFKDLVSKTPWRNSQRASATSACP